MTICIFLDYSGTIYVSDKYAQDDLNDSIIPKFKELIKKHNINLIAHSLASQKSLESIMGDDIKFVTETKKDISKIIELSSNYDVSIIIDDELYPSKNTEEEYNVDFVLQPNYETGLTKRLLYYLEKYIDNATIYHPNT